MFNARQVYVLYSEGYISIIFFSRVFGQCSLLKHRNLRNSSSVKDDPRLTLALKNNHRGQILGRNPDKSHKSFPPCYSQSLLQLYLEISIFSSNSRNLKSENSQNYAQKPKRNCTLINSASGNVEQLGLHKNPRPCYMLTAQLSSFLKNFFVSCTVARRSKISSADAGLCCGQC
jgi:hypothetical protein